LKETFCPALVLICVAKPSICESPWLAIEPWIAHTVWGVPAFRFSDTILLGASLNVVIAVWPLEVAVSCNKAPVALPSVGICHLATTAPLARPSASPVPPSVTLNGE
jgi:hypothetical protein